MTELSTKAGLTTLTTRIGLEIHVQLKTKSKMFCRCNNQAQGKAPNTVVCPVCLGLPGALPVANRQAIEWTIKTGLALNCEIPKIAKFDRKHYFYPDLPKGYQISQYDEPFAIKGSLKLKVESQKSKAEEEEITIRLNRIHLEEDAGKLIHSGNKSLVDLNRAGTPLMEIVTEPDILSPEMAGVFLRKLQKIVRDVAQVSEASMEKGHLRCDANISVSDESGKMSPIIELKNLNSFKFVEKALTLVEEKLNSDYPNWPTGNTKETWGYNSENNTVYLQRRKEEAADYRYFPCPDLPPFDSSAFNLEELKSQLGADEESTVSKLISSGVSEFDAKVITNDRLKLDFFNKLSSGLSGNALASAAKSIAHNYFGFVIDTDDLEKANEYAKAIKLISEGKIQKQVFAEIAGRIKNDNVSFESISQEYLGGAEFDEGNIKVLILDILEKNPDEVNRLKKGERQLIGFFMGIAMKELKGRGDPAVIKKFLIQELEQEC